MRDSKLPSPLIDIYSLDVQRALGSYNRFKLIIESKLNFVRIYLSVDLNLWIVILCYSKWSKRSYHTIWNSNFKIEGYHPPKRVVFIFMFKFVLIQVLVSIYQTNTLIHSFINNIGKTAVSKHRRQSLTIRVPRTLQLDQS